MLQILIYIIQSLASLYATLVILRLMLQLAKADFYNPICQFIVKVTRIPLTPLRRIIPSVMGIDTASFVLAVLIQIASITVILLIAGYSLIPAKLVTWGLINTFGLMANLFFWTLIISVILSWVAPGSYHPGAQMIMQLNEPLLAPIRRILPDMGGIDISAMLAIMIIHVFKMILSQMAAATGMFVGLSVV